MSSGITSTIGLTIRTLPENFDRSRIVSLIETIEQELYEGGVSVQTDQLLGAANLLNELGLV